MAPTVYEIGEHFKVKASTVFAQLHSLQRKNFLRRTSKARSISLYKPKQHQKVRCNGVFYIPYLGKSTDLENKRNQGSREIICDPSVLTRADEDKELFAIRVDANTMKKTGIYKGDIAILDKSLGNLKSGDIVLVQVKEKLKLRFYHQIDEKHIALTSSSPVKYPMVRSIKSKLPIHGVLIGLQRSL